MLFDVFLHLPVWTDDEIPESPDSFPSEYIEGKAEKGVKTRNQEKSKPVDKNDLAYLHFSISFPWKQI